MQPAEYSSTVRMKHNGQASADWRLPQACRHLLQLRQVLAHLHGLRRQGALLGHALDGSLYQLVQARMQGPEVH